MPAPPILDIYVVWHPADRIGQQVFERIQMHFHSEGYSGLAGGAVEVFARSSGWESPDGPPRPLLLPGLDGGPMRPAQFNAIVPVMGMRLRNAVQSDPEWARYLGTIADSVGNNTVVLPADVSGVNLQDSDLQTALAAIQHLPSDAANTAGLLERSVAQAIAEKVAELTGPIQIFISHTKHLSGSEKELPGGPLYDQVRSVIANTHLIEFFDAHDLTPGMDWAAQLDRYASNSALLMVRTDRYASREWTQREVHLAKQHDVPIVGLIALSEGEERGSFLMDHVPTVPLRNDVRSAIKLSLDRLVDEVLKRALWVAQSTYIREEGFDWTPVHAPEPVTAVAWLRSHQVEQPSDDHLWIIHPDPPLGPIEREVVDGLCTLAGFESRVDILTPRTFAARGGVLNGE